MKLTVTLSLCAGFALLLFGGCDRNSAGSASATKKISAPVDVAAVRTKAEGGDAAAQAQLGKLYEKGEGVASSYKEAAKWFKASAEKGNAEGQAGLAELYDAGQGGVSRDKKEALRLYRLAAEQGNSGAQYALGFAYETGSGVVTDQAEAAKWYKRSAEGGEPIAQFDIAQRYELGVGVKADNVEALKWYLLAANQGQADSVKRGDNIKGKMSRAEVAEAKKRAAAFVARGAMGSSPNAQ